MVLLDILHNEARDRLLTATPETFLAFQAEANAFDRVRKLITKPSIAELQAKYIFKES